MSDVTLYVYDLSGGWMKTWKKWFCSELPNGIWHVSIAVYDTEITFNQDNGIECHDLIEDSLEEKPSTEISLGNTTKTTGEVNNFIRRVQETFCSERYDLFRNNCINFANKLCLFLLDIPLPSHISDLPDLLLRLAERYTIVSFFVKYYKLTAGGSRAIGAASHSRPISASRSLRSASQSISFHEISSESWSSSSSSRIYSNRLRGELDDLFSKRKSCKEIRQMYTRNIR